MDVEKTDFEEYLEKYCIKHSITPEEAQDHLIIQLVKQQYEGKN